MGEVFEVTPASDDARSDHSNDTSSSLADPVSYLVEVATQHQIVLLGDQRGVAQHLEVLAEAVEPLHEAGVRNLAWEFTNSRRQDDLDRVCQAETWDRRLALALFVDLMGIGHAYDEYVDVIHAVWKRNAERPDGWPPFRLVGVGLPSYVEDPDLLDGRSAAETELRNWWLGGHYRDVSAIHMANVITNEIIRRGERAVVYADADRTDTRFVATSDEHVTISPGVLLGNWMGPGVARVLFHGALDDIDSLERVEALVEASPDPEAAFGIDLERSTLGNVRVRNLDGFVGSITGTFDLGDLTDGYLYVVPRGEWRPASLSTDLLGPDTVAAAERRYRALDPRDEPYTVDELEAVRTEGHRSIPDNWPTPLPIEPEDTSKPVRRFGRRR